MLPSPERSEFDIFVSTSIGSFKHIKYHTDKSLNTKKCIENLQDISSLRKGDRVTCMSWGGPDQTEVIIGRENRVVQCYDTVSGVYGNRTVEHGTGHIVGAGRIGHKLVTATSDGTVQVWGKRPKLMTVGGHVDKMKLCPDEKGTFVTGGKENDLKVWRAGVAEPLFSAKNVRADWLELRCPVWATDVCFLPGGSSVVASCSRHGTVRLYDTRVQRRPVSDVPFPNMAATCISPGLGERQVLVGFARGQMHNVDLRGRGRQDKGFKGSVGAVTAAEAVPGAPYVVSVSLDRHVKVHHALTKELLYKQYLTSKLTCLLVQTATSTPLTKVKEEVKDEAPEPEVVEVEDLDDIFQDMETVSEEKAVKRKKAAKRQKVLDPEVEIGSEDDVKSEEEEDQDIDDEQKADDGIAKLLKLTEKKKKKLEKIKKKKKAKSLFHNA